MFYQVCHLVRCLLVRNSKAMDILFALASGNSVGKGKHVSYRWKEKSYKRLWNCFVSNIHFFFLHLMYWGSELPLWQTFFFIMHNVWMEHLQLTDWQTSVMHLPICVHAYSIYIDFCPGNRPRLISVSRTFWK